MSTIKPLKSSDFKGLSRWQGQKDSNYAGTVLDYGEG